MLNDQTVVDLLKSINVKNPTDDVFDIAVIERNNWQMFGSRKPNNQCYALTNIYKLNDTSVKKVKIISQIMIYQNC